MMKLRGEQGRSFIFRACDNEKYMNFDRTGLANFNRKSYWLNRLTRMLIILNHRGGAYYLILSLYSKATTDEVLARVLFDKTSA